MRQPLPLASYQLPTPQAGCQRLVNCMVEKAETGKDQVILRRCSGISPFGEVEGAGSCRGFTVMGDTLFGVIGTGLYEIDSAGTATAVTGSIPGSTRVKVANNGTDIVVTLPDGTGYESDGSTVSQIVDGTFTGWGGTDVEFLDGYFVFRRPGTHNIFSSGLYAVSFSALDITSIDGSPDQLVGMIVNNRELILPGTESTERWYNAANPEASPFSRSPGGNYQMGCLAGDSLANQDNSPFMLAHDKTIRRLSGVWQRVSQHAIEAKLQRFALLSDCFAIPYDQEGHLCLAFNFPNAGETLVFDVTTGQWFERDSLGYGSWRVNCIANVYGKQIVGDRLSGKFGVLDPKIFEEWGEPQRVRWSYPQIDADRNLVSLRRFELEVAAGQGVVTGQGSNPLATFKLSKDGGETFTSRGVRSLGVRGNYTARVIWLNNGSARSLVPQIDVTDPIPLFVIGTYVEADGGRF